MRILFFYILTLFLGVCNASGGVGEVYDTVENQIECKKNILKITGYCKRLDVGYSECTRQDVVMVDKKTNKNILKISYLFKGNK